jgi:hypothetical protein
MPRTHEYTEILHGDMEEPAPVEINQGARRNNLVPVVGREIFERFRNTFCVYPETHRCGLHSVGGREGDHYHLSNADMGDGGSGSCFRVVEEETFEAKIMDASVGADSPDFVGFEIVRSRDLECETDGVAVDTAVVVI